MLQALCNFGTLKQGNKYEVLSECRDGLLVKARGKSIWVPFFVFDDSM